MKQFFQGEKRRKSILVIIAGLIFVVALVLIFHPLNFKKSSNDSQNSSQGDEDLAALVDFVGNPFASADLGNREYTFMYPKTWSDIYMSSQKYGENGSNKSIDRIFFQSAGNINFVITPQDKMFAEFFLSGDIKEIEDYDVTATKFTPSTFCDAIKNSNSDTRTGEVVSCTQKNDIYEFERKDTRVINGKDFTYSIFGAWRQIPDSDKVVMVRYTNFALVADPNLGPLEIQIEKDLRYTLSTFKQKTR